ncbi:ABC transporter permease [Aurantimonas sp. Leaf443]|uniref:ABC transporter permease n=1 Tax=Aurantimonas sp. Leaf443 TaxID=1736378 RepID=UPI0006F45892|nr:ABC transporter permease [Aurantimonas sp. Leaf443]KQT85099.1 branched-chain amino acid ABC transporter permease [Aurantimonas sp. Leaf443]
MSVLKARETLLLAAAVLLVLFVSSRSADFATARNLATIFTDTSILVILALGQAAVIMTRSIDLSVAANLAFTGMAAAMINAAMPGLPIPLIVLFCLGMGLCLGAINGLLVWKLSLPPIVVTLGTLTIYRGLAFVLSGGAWVNTFQMSESFLALPRAQVLGLPVLAWIAILAIAGAFVTFGWTRFGRALYATGGNPVAAVYAGIDAGRTTFLAFCLSGALAGLCGYLWVSRFAVAYVDVASGFELDVIAACVIGGISIAGGIGSVAGAVLGALFLGILKNALPVVGVSPFWQMAISGAIIVAAVTLNTRAEKTRGRVILRRIDANAGAPA